MSDSIDARPRYESCRPFDCTDSYTSRCVTSVRLWAGIQSSAERRQCDVIPLNRLFFQLSVKAIQIVKFFRTIFTFHVTILKLGLATSRASLMVLSVDMYWTTSTANCVTVFRSATYVKNTYWNPCIKTYRQESFYFLGSKNQTFNSYMEFMLESVKLSPVQSGPTGCVCVCVCDLGTSITRRPRPDLGCSVT